MIERAETQSLTCNHKSYQLGRGRTFFLAARPSCCLTFLSWFAQNSAVCPYSASRRGRSCDSRDSAAKFRLRPGPQLTPFASASSASCHDSLQNEIHCGMSTSFEVGLLLAIWFASSHSACSAKRLRISERDTWRRCRGSLAMNDARLTAATMRRSPSWSRGRISARYLLIK